MEQKSGPQKEVVQPILIRMGSFKYNGMCATILIVMAGSVQASLTLKMGADISTISENLSKLRMLLQERPFACFR
jgi:hypothetical protein